MPSGCVHILTSSISTTTSRTRARQSMNDRARRELSYMLSIILESLTRTEVWMTASGSIAGEA